MKIIEIEKEDIPYHFEIELGDKSYNISINYNPTGDFFSLVTKYDDNIISSEKLILNKPLYTETYKKNKPTLSILPYTVVEEITRITYDNFNSDVFLYIVDFDDYSEDEINEILA